MGGGSVSITAGTNNEEAEATSAFTLSNSGDSATIYITQKAQPDCTITAECVQGMYNEEFYISAYASLPPQSSLVIFGYVIINNTKQFQVSVDIPEGTTNVQQSIKYEAGEYINSIIWGECSVSPKEDSKYKYNVNAI